MHNLSVRYLASSARTQIDRFCPSSLCFHTCYSSSPNFPYNRMHPILCVLLYQKARRKFSLLHQVPIRVNGLLAVSWSRFDCVRSTCSFNTSLFFGQREPLSDKGTSNLLPMTSVCATPPWPCSHHLKRSNENARTANRAQFNIFITKSHFNYSQQ
jgi:hypothetical protein